MFIRCDRGIGMLLVELTDGGVQDFGFHFVVIGVKDRQPLVGLFTGGGTSMGAGSASALSAPPAHRRTGPPGRPGKGRADGQGRIGAGIFRGWFGGWVLAFSSVTSFFISFLAVSFHGISFRGTRQVRTPPAAPLRRRGGKEARKGTQELIPKLIPILHYEGGVQVEIGWSSGGDVNIL